MNILSGWREIARQIKSHVLPRMAETTPATVALECSARVNAAALIAQLRAAIPDSAVLDCRCVFKVQTLIDALIAPWMAPHCDGAACPLSIRDFIDSDRLEAFSKTAVEHDGLVIIAGPGASFCCRPDLLVYVDNAAPISFENGGLRDYSFTSFSPSIVPHPATLQWIRIDAAITQRHADRSFHEWNYYINAGGTNAPVMASGHDLAEAILDAASAPIDYLPQQTHPPPGMLEFSLRPAHCGTFCIATSTAELQLPVSHVFARAGEHILGAAGNDMRRVTGLCPGGLLLQALSRDVTTAAPTQSATHKTPKFIFRREIAAQLSERFFSHDSIAGLVVLDGPVEIDYWKHKLSYEQNTPPAASRRADPGKCLIIPAAAATWQFRKIEGAGPARIALYGWHCHQGE